MAVQHTTSNVNSHFCSVQEAVLFLYIPLNHQCSYKLCKGVLALECQTRGQLVSPAYGWEKINWTPLFDLSEFRFSPQINKLGWNA